MRFYVPAALLLALVLAAPAQADVTASAITTPTSPHFEMLSARDTGIEVKGQATGVGLLDIVCATATTETVLAHNVATATDGAFWVPGLSLDPLVDWSNGELPGQTCRLRALPAGTTTGDLTAFTGPVLAVSRFATIAIQHTNNDGLLANYHVWAAGTDRAVEFDAFGSAGVSGYLLDPDTLEETDGIASAGSPIDAPEAPLVGVRVDGDAAYSPAHVFHAPGGAGLYGNPGFVPLERPTLRFDEHTGAIDVSERAPFVKCAPDVAYPPTNNDCTYFTSSPVQLQRTTSVLAGDQTVRVVDRWSSTDGHSHRLDLTLNHQVSYDGEPDYRFPGQSGYAQHDTDTVPGPFRAATPIFARDPAGPGQLVLPLQSADGARFVSPVEYGLEYRNRTIPATGEITFTHYYVTTRRADELDAAAAKLLATLPKPALPPKGGVSPTPVPAPVVAPELFRHGHVHVRRAGRTFRVTTRDRVRCAAACELAVSGRRISTTLIHADAGRTAKVRFRLTRGGARKLRRAGRLRLRFALAAGPVTAQRQLTLRIAKDS